MHTFTGIPDVVAAAGQHLGYSDWHTVTQREIDLFADATGDHQWIHVDPVRAAAGPFGTTIAHGYLTLSLVPVMCKQVYAVEGVTMEMNYGANKVRFLAPVPVNSKIRLGVAIREVIEGASGAQVILDMTVEIEGGSKPACVAEVVYLLVP